MKSILFNCSDAAIWRILYDGRPNRSVVSQSSSHAPNVRRAIYRTKFKSQRHNAALRISSYSVQACRGSTGSARVQSTAEILFLFLRKLSSKALKLGTEPASALEGIAVGVWAAFVEPISTAVWLQRS